MTYVPSWAKIFKYVADTLGNTITVVKLIVEIHLVLTWV